MLKRLGSCLQAMVKITKDAAKSKESIEGSLSLTKSGRIEKHSVSNVSMQPNPATTSDAVEVRVEEKVEVHPKRGKSTRYALMLGYQGKDYYGMQVEILDLNLGSIVMHRSNRMKISQPSSPICSELCGSTESSRKRNRRNQAISNSKEPHELTGLSRLFGR